MVAPKVPNYTDPWPELDFDPIRLIIDNDKDCFDYVLQIIRNYDYEDAAKHILTFIMCKMEVLLKYDVVRLMYHSAISSFLQRLTLRQQIDYIYYLTWSYQEVLKEHTDHNAKKES